MASACSPRLLALELSLLLLGATLGCAPAPASSELAEPAAEVAVPGAVRAQAPQEDAGRLVDSGAIVQDGAGRPLAGVAVTIEAGLRPILARLAYGVVDLWKWERRVTVTDDEGRFEVWERTLAESEISVALELGGWAQVTSRGSPMGSGLAESYLLLPTSEFELFCVDLDEEPVGGIRLRIVARRAGWEHRVTVQADAVGRALVSGLPDCSLEIRLERPEGRPDLLDETVVEFAAKPTGPGRCVLGAKTSDRCDLTLTASAAGGAAVPLEEVSLEWMPGPTRSSAAESLPFTATGSEARAQLAAPGFYRLAARAEGTAWWEQIVDCSELQPRLDVHASLEPAAQLRVDLDLPPGPAVDARGRGKPFPSVNLRHESTFGLGAEPARFADAERGTAARVLFSPYRPAEDASLSGLAPGRWYATLAGGPAHARLEPSFVDLAAGESRDVRFGVVSGVPVRLVQEVVRADAHEVEFEVRDRAGLLVDIVTSGDGGLGLSGGDYLLALPRGLLELVAHFEFRRGEPRRLSRRLEVDTRAGRLSRVELEAN